MVKSLGTLSLAANSVGSLDPIPERSLDALRTGDLLIFEEARGARRALKAAGVHRDFLLYSEHKQDETLAALKSCLKNGGHAVYMSDQGAPGFADPGRALANVAYTMNAKVTVIPGPSSLTAAISACPFDLDRFTYGGFPPRDTETRQKWLQGLLTGGEAIVLLDTPYRRSALIVALGQVANDRRLFVAIDIAGEHETYAAGSASQLAGLFPEQKLNFVLIVEGRKPKVTGRQAENTATKRNGFKADRSQHKRRP